VAVVDHFDGLTFCRAGLLIAFLTVRKICRVLVTVTADEKFSSIYSLHVACVVVGCNCNCSHHRPHVSGSNLSSSLLGKCFVNNTARMTIFWTALLLAGLRVPSFCGLLLKVDGCCM
jgi:hypothetical protein